MDTFAPKHQSSADFSSPLLFLIRSCCQEMGKNDRRSGGARWRPYFQRLRLWSSQPKNTHGQTVGGFCRDLSPQTASLRVSGGHVAIPAEASTWIAGRIRMGEGRLCVCECASRHGGKGVSGGMNQPLSSATRPLTYRARFSKTQRSTLTLSRISLSLLAISHCLPHLSHQR